MTREQRNLNAIREMAQGGEMTVYMPLGQERLRDFFGAPAQVIPSETPRVHIRTVEGRVVELLPAERDDVYRVALGLPLPRAWMRSVESARRRIEVVQSHQHGETALVAARLQQAGVTHAELQLPADPDLIRERTDDLVRAALGTDAERRTALAQLTDDVLSGWFLGYAPPVTAAHLTAWAREQLGLTLTVTVGVGTELPRLKALWAERDPHLERVVLGLLRRTEVS